MGWCVDMSNGLEESLRIHKKIKLQEHLDSWKLHKCYTIKYTKKTCHTPFGDVTDCSQCCYLTAKYSKYYGVEI